MTKIRIKAEPHTQNRHFTAIDVEWDDEAGTVVGQGADEIIKSAKLKTIACGPWPQREHKLSKDPLRNKTDMAAIIGQSHRLPDFLQDFYPRFQSDSFPDKTYMDENGVMVIGLDRVQY